MRKTAKLLGVILAGCVAFTSFPLAPAQAAVSTQKSVADETKVTGLTTNYQTNPLGIEASNIRFGWQMDSKVIGAKQTAYQVRVFAKDQSVVWDSGKVNSSRSTGIACGGTIAERNSYRWEVTVWDQAGNTHTAEASFETAVSNVQEWKDAEFIRMNKSRLAPVFRTEQSLTRKDMQKARLYITSLGVYEAYVNGNRVGEWDEDGNLIYHHMNPGYGNRDVSLGYQTYDVTKFLTGVGSAAVAINAGTGWYNGMGNTDVSSPAVKALLMIDYADGSTQAIKTNTADWKGTLAGGITASGIYYGEDYNAIFAKELGDYTKTGYDDSKWVNAQGTEDGDTESSVSPRIVNKFVQQTASYARLVVKASGPADNNNENLLQIMELELLDADKNNIVKGIVPEMPKSWSPNGQWSTAHLTDGDLGLDSDKGCTSEVMGRGLASCTFEQPISITFNLGGVKTFDTLRLYPRTSVTSISGNECANYPKVYTLQISQDGTNWTDVDLNGDVEGVDYTVENLRNTEKYPEAATGAAHYDTDFGKEVTAKKVKISVSQAGPAVYETNDNDKENRLQIMELELWDGMRNVAANVTPVISNNFEAGTQWRAANLTDGDYGVESDSGYTSEILDRQKPTVDLEQPITIEFDFDEAVTFSGMRVFPRSGKNSILGGIYANYPKVYTVSVSENGTDWTDLVTEDKGMIRKQEDLQGMRMSVADFPGVIRAQNGLPGRMTGEFDQNPVSSVVYSGTKAESQYAAGEINVLEEYTGADFATGIMLEKGQTMIVNMGQNLTAVPNIRFSAPCGSRAVMRFAEMLNDGSKAGNGATEADGPKGSIYQKSLRGARSQATYVFSGDGVETYQPSMSFFGYQYVELTASDDMVIYGLTSKGISSVSEQLGTISTNNENVNKLFRNVLFGQLSNYYTAPTDCNQRDERLSWTGDTQAFAQTAGISEEV